MRNGYFKDEATKYTWQREMALLSGFRYSGFINSINDI